MSWDVKLASIYFAGAGLILFLLIIGIVMRWIINHAFAKDGHESIVRLTGQEPRCRSCPFSIRCPYSNGVVCHFTKKTSTIPL